MFGKAKKNTITRQLPRHSVFDEKFTIPVIGAQMEAGECVALLGVKETDISEIFRQLSLDTGIKDKNRKHDSPTLHCVKRKSDIFLRYTGYENILLSEKRFIPYSKKQLVELVEDMRGLFGFDIDFDKRMDSISASQQVMVDIIRASIIDPDIYVFDRIISQLEYKHSNIFSSIVKSLLDRGKYVIYLTSKWEDAIKVATRVLVVMDGVVLGEMNAEEVKRNPQQLVYLMSGKTLIEEHSHQNETVQLLNMLYTGAEYLSDNYEISDALKYITHSIAQVLHANNAVIYLLDEDTDQIHSFSHAASSSADLLNDDFLRYHSNDMKTPLFYYNFENKGFKSYFLNPDTPNKTMICVPIAVKGRPRGLLQVTFHTFFIYDDEQRLFLRSFCKEIAMIIETSQLMGSSVLLQESNHRIKNNLQIVINLISLQQMYVAQKENSDIIDVLNAIIGRIQNIASVHELLTSKKNNHAIIKLNGLVGAILHSFDLKHVDVVIDIDDVYIPHAKATSISMVINELVTNSVKYAFHDRKSGNSLTISCKKKDDHILISVLDNGSGMPDHFDLNNSFSIGFSIVKSIVQIDLKGKIDLQSSSDGTSVNIMIPAYFSG